MPSDCVSYQNSGWFSALITDYLNQKSELQPLYNRFPNKENFLPQIQEKSTNFNPNHRAILHRVLNRQYQGFTVSLSTQNHIDALQRNNTFTVTTGHQLNLFTGPLYFLYKIISTINLCKELKKQYPDYNFVPVYWMATEDHDFDEICFFNFENIKFKWNKNASGPVGRLDTDGLKEIYEAFSTHLGIGKNAEQIKKWFIDAYLQHENLADATRYLANELFGNDGLVIIDGDDTELKQMFAPYIQRELTERQSKSWTEESFTILSDYNIQVNPREINLFYIENNLRERIVFEDNQYRVLNTSLAFSEEEIIQLLHDCPEKFSPNVILRPLYQEVILPNLCYIGGGGELAYWLELKAIFDNHNVTFPMLLLRNSVLLSTEKQSKKADKLGITWQDLFLKKEKLITAKTSELSTNTFDFEQQKQFLQKQFESLRLIAQQTDKSFIGAVEAQEKKQIKGLQNLEKRLLKAEKKLHREQLERISELQESLFPNGSLQERQVNFAEFYKIAGNDLLSKLYENLNPLDQKFTIITL